MFIQRKYNTATVAGSHIRIPMIKRSSTDFALSADWTPVAGDVTVSKDGGAAVNIATLPTAVTVGNSAFWQFPLSAAELSCKQVTVTIADAAPKAVEDNMFIVETYGNAAAMIPLDLSDGTRMGMTALPNASPAANGGLPTVNASNFVAGIMGTKNTLDALNDIATGSAMTLELSQPIPAVNVPQTVGDALNAARAEGFGRWVADTASVPPTITLYAADGLTPVRVFQVDSASSPTQRN
jgi:hypothetical protein